jgi:hypothetical protein
VSDPDVDTVFLKDENDLLRHEDIDGASEWEPSIRKGLESCDWFLVALTPRAVNSRWVKTEVAWAMEERQGRVIPVLLEDCRWRELNLQLLLIQQIDLRQPSDDSRKKLISVIMPQTPSGEPKLQEPADEKKGDKSPLAQT